jgi:hypothetical protein
VNRITQAAFATAALLGILLLASASGARGAQPPGNDGPYCHGANREACRPDPQPSHGAECKDHGRNVDGNDDHCLAPLPTPNVTLAPPPTPTITLQPSEAPSVSPSSSPRSKPSFVPSQAVEPLPTEPNTATAANQSGGSGSPSLIALLIGVLAGCVGLLSPRRRPSRA